MAISSIFALSVLFLVAPVLVAGQDPGDAASGGPTSTGVADGAAGAIGTSTGAFDLSKGGMVAVILVAVLVGGGGIASAILFYVAKKRQWEIRKSLRRSARRLTGGLNSARAQRASRRQTGIPPTPRTPKPAMLKKTNTTDLEKGLLDEGSREKNDAVRTTTRTLNVPTSRS